MTDLLAVDWKPACDIEHMRLRAQMLTTIRTFFSQRDVLEVETPLLCHATGTDPQLDFFSTAYHCIPSQGSAQERVMYLQTSPEFAMKRLLAAGSGSIFQVCKAFRNGEAGRLHNPEFSILEWYRVGFSLDQLMDEVIDLIFAVLNEHVEIKRVEKISYSDLFERVTGLNPLIFCQQGYQHYAEQNNLGEAVHLCTDDHAMWLDFIFSHKVQSTLSGPCLNLVYGYPSIQSSLARINPVNPAIADRVEVFIDGMEIGNGFFELTDAVEQELRFDREIQCRKNKAQPIVKKDKLFLDALKSGLPECSGIAIGLDRLLMIKANARALSDVLAFPFARA